MTYLARSLVSQCEFVNNFVLESVLCPSGPVSMTSLGKKLSSYPELFHCGHQSPGLLYHTAFMEDEGES
jgi:hypothetical protein